MQSYAIKNNCWSAAFVIRKHFLITYTFCNTSCGIYIRRGTNEKKTLKWNKPYPSKEAQYLYLVTNWIMPFFPICFYVSVPKLKLFSYLFQSSFARGKPQVPKFEKFSIELRDSRNILEFCHTLRKQTSSSKCYSAN